MGILGTSSPRRQHLKWPWKNCSEGRGVRGTVCDQVIQNFVTKGKCSKHGKYFCELKKTRSLKLKNLARFYVWGFPGSSAGKESACNAGDPSLIPGSGRSTGEGIGYGLQYSWASLVAQRVKNLLQCGRPGFDPWIGKIPWRREWLPTPLFCSGSQRVGHNRAMFIFTFMYGKM